MKKPLLLLALLVSLITGAALAATGPMPNAVAPTMWLPGDDTIGSAAGDQRSAAIARGGNAMLTVWADYRSDITGYQYFEYETSGDIYGMRLDANGDPIDALPFPITQAAANQTSPKVAWNGTHWLVVFESYALNGTGFYYEKSLAAVRVAADGTVVDAAPQRIYGVEPTGGDWTVAAEGDSWVIAFQTGVASNDIQAIRVAADGTPVLPPISLVPETYYLRYNLRLACSSGVCLATFNDFGTSTAAIRFDSDLNVLGNGMYTLLNAPLSQLAANDTGFYAAWNQQRQDFSQAVYGSRIDLDGALLDGAGDDISLDRAPNGVINATWGGGVWVVVWDSADGVAGARVSTAGQVLDPGGVVIPGATAGRMVAAPAGGLQTVWYALDNNQYDVYTGYISPAANAGPAQRLSIGAPRQTHVDAAAGASGYLVAYRSDVGDEQRLMVQPLDAAGNPLTAAPVLLDAGAGLNGPGAPAVAWNGSHYLVTWDDGNSIVGTRVQADGTVLDATPIEILDGFGSVDVAALNGDFLVIGHQFGISEHYVHPIAARVRGSDGAVLDPTALNLGFSYARTMSVTAFADRWLVVWQRNVTHDDPLALTQAAFVYPDGTKDPEFMVYGWFSSAGGNQTFELSVDASANEALVVQSDEISSGVETDLVGIRVLSDGTVLPATTLTPWSGNQYRPAVAWDGAQFIVAYHDQKNRFAPHTLDQLDARSDLFAMRIAADGTVIDPQGFAFSNAPLGETHPDVAAASGAALILGSVVRDAPYASYRIGYALFGGANEWPVAVTAPASAAGDVPLTVTFSSVGSADTDGIIAGYLWDFGDGATSTVPNPTHTYTEPGQYVATLTVTDDDGATTVNTVRVEAEAPNQLPVAVASADVTHGGAPLSVVFSAAGSYDPDGSIGNIKWEFGDGGTYWGSPAYHTFYTPGVYTVTLTVWDDDFATGTTTLPIAVYEPCPANCVRATQLEMGSATFQGTLYVGGRVTVANEFGVLQSGASVSVSVTRPDGSTLTSTRTTAADGRVSVGVPYNEPGEYVLTITDIAKDGFTFDPAESILTGTIDVAGAPVGARLTFGAP